MEREREILHMAKKLRADLGQDAVADFGKADRGPVAGRGLLRVEEVEHRAIEVVGRLPQREVARVGDDHQLRARD